MFYQIGNMKSSQFFCQSAGTVLVGSGMYSIPSGRAGQRRVNDVMAAQHTLK